MTEATYYILIVMAEENLNQPKTDSGAPELTQDPSVRAGIKPIRTYQSDVEQLLKEGEGSFAKIAIAESEKKARAGFAPTESDAPKSRMIIIISVGLAVVAVGILLSVYFFRNVSQQPVTVLEPPPLIVTDSTKDIDLAGLNRAQILDTLSRERDTNPATLSTTVALKLTEGKGDSAHFLTANEFFQKLQTQAPDELVRSLEDSFTFGIYALSKNQPFLILKTSYYQNAFAGMLAWESNLRNDIGRIFIPDEPQIILTTSDQVTDVNTKFEDVVIKNRDTRSLRSKDGKVILLYTFADKNTIIITTGADTLEQVVTRLLAGKLVQ